MGNRAIYTDREAAKTERFFDDLYAEAKGKNSGEGVLDSANAKAVTRSLLDNASGSGIVLPARLQGVLAKMPESDQARALDAVVFGMGVYEREHGCLPTADVIEAALQQGDSASYTFDRNGRYVLDNVGSTSHHDPISSQPNRIVVAITSAIAEAIPFGVYLPTDIGSNEARLGIIQHLAGSTFGDYDQNEIMDGVNCGKSYFSAERRVQLALNGDRDEATGGIFTTVGGSTTVKLLRGRTLVFINGFKAAEENPNVGAAVANSPISGSIDIGGTQYTVSGTVAVATGALSLAFSPALPSGTVVEAEGFIDYEDQSDLTPSLITQVNTYALYAVPWRAKARQSVDSKTQYQNELGLDLQSENLIAIRNQFAMERHYNALFKLLRLAANNAAEYDFDATNQIQQKTRAQIWQDFGAVLGVVDQQMAEDTMDHGISHMYVTKNVAYQMMSLPREIFEPSGLQARPGIFRVGRLFGRYEVYYTPKLLTEGSTTSQILCIGRSVQVARNPVVLGDAVAPTYIPLATQDDLTMGSGFYARNFTSVNPHVPSAKGAALINVTNLF